MVVPFGLPTGFDQLGIITIPLLRVDIFLFSNATHSWGTGLVGIAILLVLAFFPL